MSSRRILWAILILAALPPVLEATAGCSYNPPRGSSPPTPTEDNALMCACSFDAAGSRTLRIQASSDDAEQDVASMDLTSDDLDLSQKLVGLRFDGIKIPNGVTIASAYVQFTADASQGGTTSLTIDAEASPAAAPFTATDNDLSGRTAGSAAAIPWTIPAWANNDAGLDQRTPDLSPLLQELVGLPLWSMSSPVVLRFQTGTGQRTAESFDQTSARAPELVVTLSGTLTAEIPVCALPDPPRDATGAILPDTLVSECARVATTLAGLNSACGLPTAPTCTVVDLTDPNGDQTDDSTESDVCKMPCTPDEVDPNVPATCSKYDPIAFADCLASGMPLAVCKNLVTATNATGDSPVCVNSGSALAFHAFGRRSRCEVRGTAVINVDGRRPKADPDTEGTVEILGGPCPGGSCPVHPYLDLRMDDIEFEVRWAKNPKFGDLNSSGRGLETALLDAGLASFAPASVAGSVSGRRIGEAEGLSVDATNDEPLDVGVDWIGRTCTLDGGLALGVGDDGLCEVDGTTPCATDADCTAVGGVCILPPDTAPMQADVVLAGTLVNQPPAADAGADQTIECTGTAGATFTLDGNASSDPDGNLVLASWRQGSRTGPELSNGFSVAQTLGVGVAESYVLRVIDGFAQMDEASTNASVVDTTPPELSISVAPTTLWPPNHKLVPITVSVVTSDICDAAPAIRLLSITSNESANGSGDGNTSSDVSGASFGQDDRQFKLRAERSGNGSGRIYTITYEAADDSGNATVRQTTVSVAHNQGG